MTNIEVKLTDAQPVNIKVDGYTSQTVKAEVERLEERVDTIITTPVEGVSAQEIIDARSGKVSLGQKITEIDTRALETIKFDGQVDYVDLIRNRTKYNAVYAKKISSPYEALSVFCSNGKDHVTHEWRKNANDDYWIYHVGFLGEVKTLAKYKASTSAKTGVWTSPDGSGNVYTTEVGATFTVNIQGEQIALNHLADTRGGMFSIVIDGDTSNPVFVSTYASSTILKQTIVAKGLRDIMHTVVGTFMGNDPDNAPTSTARGWIRDDQSSPEQPERYTMIGGVPYNGVYNTVGNKMVLAYASNKDWAFSLTKNGVTNWFPEHNATGTAFKIYDPRIIVDGEEIPFSDMVVEDLYQGKNVQFMQKVQCIFPGITDPLAEVEILFSIGLDGVVSISGYFKVLQDVLINNGYTFMMPIEQTIVDEFLSSIGTHVVNAGDNSNLNLTNDKYSFSFAGVDGVNKDIIGAVSIDYPLKTLRQNQPGVGNPLYFINQRTQYPKLYPLVYFAHNALAGEKYIFNGRFAVGKIPNIYNYVK